MTHGELLTHQVLVKEIINNLPKRDRQSLLTKFFDKLKELQNKNMSCSAFEMENYLLENAN